jgi:predicted TIM-barrel fold metal-dependent hydrolase
VIDGFVFHDVPSMDALLGYLPGAWREVVARSEEERSPVLNPNGNWLYYEPSLDGARPRASWTFTSLEDLFRRRSYGADDRVVLGYGEALLTTASAYHHLASAVVSALNDWTIEEWLGRDERLYGMVLVTSGLPDQAAAEIRRAGEHDRMVAVALGANKLGMLFGHPVYEPIYAAAAEMRLPIVLQVGSDAAFDLNTTPVAGGPPATFGEYSALSGQAMQSHLASMITEGVFARYPSLRVLLVGGGLTWVAPYLWRIDWCYDFIQRESPALTKPPSHYFFDHVRLATYSMETVPTPAQLGQALSVMPQPERLLLYASGAPSTEAAEPADVAARLPDDWHEQVFDGTAERLFRWPRPLEGDAATAGSVALAAEGS